jgi:hypothetical protein
LDKSTLQAYAKMLTLQVGQRMSDDEIRFFLDALGPVLKERIRKVLNTIEVTPVKK